MVINGSPIPNGYDNTYDTAEVSRPDMDRRANWAEENPEAPQYIRNKEEGSGSGGDCGYSCSGGVTLITSETINSEHV